LEPPLETIIDIPRNIRIDENWTDKNESLALEWQKKSEIASVAHNKSGLKNKFKHVITGLPAVLIPAIFAPLSVALEGVPGVEYVSMAGFIATGVFGGINGFFNYSNKHQKHMDFSARYGDVVSDVQYELSMQRPFRIAPDRFLMKIQMKLDNLSANAPDL
jgi:hypothetical protein